MHGQDGSVYVAGHVTNVQNFPFTAQLMPQRWGSYVMKLDDTDGSLVWCVDVGHVTCYDLALTPNGNVVLAGSAVNAVPVSPDAFQTTSHDVLSHYLLELGADGAFHWATFIGGEGVDLRLSVVTASGDRVFFAGTTQSRTYPVTGVTWGESYHGGQRDLVVGCVSDSGRSLDWCGCLGGSQSDGNESERGTGLARDDSGNLYLYSSTTSPDLPVTPDVYSGALNGTRMNGMMASLGEDGQLRWLSYFGGPELTIGWDVALLPGRLVGAGKVVPWDGATESLPVTPNALSDTLRGGSDGYLFVLHTDDIVPTQLQSADLTWDAGTAVLRWRLSGEAAGLRAEVVTAAGVRELPVQQEPDGGWIARDDRACAEGAAPRTYRLVLPGENRWTVLWRREVTPECAAAGPLRLAGRLLGGGAVELRLRSPQAGPARLALYDLAGRRVAALPPRTVPAGESVWEWDGRTEAGARAPAGRYLARCTVAGRVVTAAVTLIR